MVSRSKLAWLRSLSECPWNEKNRQTYCLQSSQTQIDMVSRLMPSETIPNLSSAFAAVETTLKKDLDSYLQARQNGTVSQKIVLDSLRNSLRELRVKLECQGTDLSLLCGDLIQKSSHRQDLRLLLASFFFDACKAQIFWNETMRLAREMMGNLSASYSLLLNAEYLAFMNKAAFPGNAYLHMARRPLKIWYQELYEQQHHSSSQIQRRPGHVAMLLRLWRNPGMYTPGLEALDYAYILTQELGFTVKFFNTNLLHDQMPVPFWPLGQFQPLPEVEEEDISYKGVVFKLAHRRGAALDSANDQEFWKKLQEFGPNFAIAFGDCNIYADQLAQSVPTVTVHYTSDIPIQVKTIPAVQQDMQDREAASEALFAPGCPRVLLRPAATDTPVTMCYARQTFGLLNNSFLFVIVGNRLRSEVTQDFLVHLEKIAAACSKARFVFVGFYDQAEEQLTAFSALRAQTTFIPHIEDVRGFMAIADAMLNPDRAGGGHAAAQALAEGKPVLSLGRGDVAYVLGHSATCTDYAALVTRAIQFVTDQNVYKTWADYSAQRYKELIDRQPNLFAMRQVIAKVVS
jgi:hypothetical protein